MGEDKLTRDDLVLLMESYRNMITMHQTILDQTNKTIDKLDSIANKQDSLFSKQGNICSSLNKITTTLEGNISSCKKNTDKINDLSNTVTEKINNHDKKTIEDHGKITNKIYIGWVGMISIILALIGLTLTAINIIPNIPIP